MSKLISVLVASVFALAASASFAEEKAAAPAPAEKAAAPAPALRRPPRPLPSKRA